MKGVFDAEEAIKIAESGGNGKNAIKVVKANIPLVEEARQQSLQARPKGEAPIGGGVLSNLSYLYFASDTLPPWWSRQRDSSLTEFWKSVNLLSGAMYAMVSKLTTIPFHIEPRDPAITAHFREASRFERRLYESAEFGEGWIPFFSKQLQSLLGQDNGRFMEIIDLSKNKVGPLLGPAISVAHMSPNRCTRTSNPKYPVVYQRTDGTLRKIHWTRVAYNSQLPSERIEMLGVGLSAISRAASYAQHMLDISVYKEEKLGSRPKRGILLVKGGLDAESVGTALQTTDNIADSRGLRRFAMLPIIGSPDIEEPDIALINLSELPDGFDEQSSTDIAMAAIALAFGVDARELWPQSQSGATRADALLSHIKQRGKGPGQIIQQTEHMFNNYFLPPYLKMVFDYQDDAQDRQRAEIRKERSLTRKQDIAVGVTDLRAERERMVRESEISTAQFAELELGDGRLPNGKPLETLFYNEKPEYTTILALPGISDPLDIRGNDPDNVLDAISKQIPVAMEVIANESKQNASRRAREALAALRDLQLQYETVLSVQEEELSAQERAQGITSEGRQGVREGADSNAEDESAIGVRPSDEANLSQENSPRDFKKGIMSIFSRKSKKRSIRKALGALQDALDQPEPPTVVAVDVPPAQVTVNIPEQKTPTVNVSAPVVNVPKQDAPIINIPPQKPPVVNISPQEINAPPITVNVPKEKERINEDIELERNEMGEIIGLKRRKAKE